METEAQVVILLAVAVLVGYISSKIRVPYTIAMVITGLGVSLAQLRFWNLNAFHLEPRLILLTFLPGLLFEASYHIDIAQFRDNLRPILLLAVPGVFLSTLITGLLVQTVLGLPLADAMLFGVLISATDPISVTSLIKTLGVDRRLGIILEGESLFNDGVSIVVFGILVGLATGARSFSVIGGISTFVVTFLGGILLGGLAGLLFSEFMRRTEEPLIDLGLTTVLAYGVYLLAEQVFHGLVSPVIAVVVAGIIVGNYGSEGRHGATTNAMILVFWEFIVFLINSAIFFLIGFEVDLGQLAISIQPVILSIIAILATRAIVVYALRYLINRRDNLVPLRWAHIIYWGGLRGAVSIALALSLPLNLPTRSLLITLTFGYVLFSLIVKGLTISPLLHRLGLTRASSAERSFQEMMIKMAGAQAALQAIDDLHRDNMLSDAMTRRLRREYTESVRSYQRQLDLMVVNEPTLAKVNAQLVQREIAFSQKQALVQLLRRGVVSEEIYRMGIHEIDERLRQEEMQDRIIPEPHVEEPEPIEQGEHY